MLEEYYPWPTLELAWIWQSSILDTLQKCQGLEDSWKKESNQTFRKMRVA